MNRKPTIRDIAKQAGVSDTAVSLAFKDNSRLSGTTRERILAIARKINYFPNQTARALRSGGPVSIGFIVTDITDPFYSRMIRSAERIALECGYSLLFAESNWDPDKEIEVVSSMIESRVRGILMCFCEKTPRSMTLIEQSKVHVIAVDTYPHSYRGPYVANDVERAGYMAAEHLVEVGSRRPVFFNANESMKGFSAFSLLLRGFGRSLRAQQIPFSDSHVINADITIEGGTSGFARMQKTGQPFDGIFCVNDLCAFGVIEAAEKSGRTVGEDLAVMGIDNLEISDVSRISLTSIDQPYDRIIELAARSIIESIECDKPCTIRRRLKPTLVVRESTTLTRTFSRHPLRHKAAFSNRR
jgi:DNA-binding LacI/PurR family transcriptional regulator